MQEFALTSDRISFRSLDEPQVAEIHRLQNSECGHEIAGMLDFEPTWAPMTLDQVKAKLEEARKEERTAVFSIWSNANEFVGVGHFAADWDPQSPFIHVIVWPKYRRKGHGSEAARLLLEACFGQSQARVVSGWVAEWNQAGLTFAESLGFKKCGVQRRAGIRDGRFFNGAFLDILRSEYLERRSRKKGAR